MGHNTPLGHHTESGSMCLGQYKSLGEYCGPHTASEVFLVLVSTTSVAVVVNHPYHESSYFSLFDDVFVSLILIDQQLRNYELKITPPLANNDI